MYFLNIIIPALQFKRSECTQTYACVIIIRNGTSFRFGGTHGKKKLRKNHLVKNALNNFFYLYLLLFFFLPSIFFAYHLGGPCPCQ
jgi:hypothetical protein